MTRPIRASESDGTTWDAPTDKQTPRPGRRPQPAPPIPHRAAPGLARPRQHYIQVYLEDDLSHTIQYREGGPDAHYTAWIPRDPSLWAAGDDTWRHALPWQPVDF